MTNTEHTLDAPGLACIDLTPLIAKTMSRLRPGEGLAVRSDDPAARVGVPAWCRLTRNQLVSTTDDPNRADTTVFHITKKENAS